MESVASRLSEPVPLDLEQLEHACELAAAAAREADTPRAAIDGALDVLQDELGGAGVCAFVLEHGRLWSVGMRGHSMIPDGWPLDEGVIGRAVRTSEAQLVLEVSSDPDFTEVMRDVVSELAVPLVLPTGVVGVIDIETTVPLPPRSEAAVASLTLALSQPMEELRAARIVDVSSLARLFVHMSSLREPCAIAEVAVRSLVRVLSIETSQLLLADETGELIELTEWHSTGGPEPMPSTALLALRARLDKSAMFALLDTSETHVPEFVGTRVRSVVVIPLRANGEEIGILAGTSRFAKKFDRAQGELAALLAAHAAASLDAALALSRERRSAHTDALTGLLNRRGLEDRLERELDEAQGERRPLSLVVLDYDDFKDVNDRAGHEFGDALLREIGLVLQGACPEGGSAARLGGDEFVIMLPGTDADTAFAVVKQLRTELDDGLDAAGFPLRLSVGLSTYPFDGGGATQLMRAADQALYLAKAGGKNRVVGFRDVARGAAASAVAAAGIERVRSRSGARESPLGDTMDASAAIWAEESVEGVLERLSKSVAFVVGGTATAISKVEGLRLADAARHSLRDIDLGEETTYLISDFPVTKEVLEKGCLRSISFLDIDLDGAEAFVLRELQMNSALLLPLVVCGQSWGLVEIYDKRLRRFSGEDEEVAWFLVCQAGRRIESLLEISGNRRHRSLLRRHFG